MINQRTIKQSVSTTGIGLHSGKKVNLTFRPAPTNSGIVFRRIDLVDVEDIKADFSSVSDTKLSTTIFAGNNPNNKVSTIEHLMSALAGLGIDNIFIDIDAAEVPIMDGSAAPFIFLIQSAGIEAQSKFKTFVKIKDVIRAEYKDAWAELRPHDGYKITFEIDFDHPAVKDTEQVLSLDFSDVSYSQNISRARTFGFMKDAETLRSMNLGLGGNLGNAILLDEYRILNQDGLRYDDEFVRHKMLDAIGDLYTLGNAIIGEYYGFKSGHHINNLLLQALAENQDAWEYTTFENDVNGQEIGRAVFGEVSYS